MTFKDHFSKQSNHYREFRPSYPSELFDFIFDLCDERELAWDCACGTGQASSALAQGFRQVLASDASQAQINGASGVENISFHCFPAENSSFDDNSFDLITVAQALHWFQLKEFFEECKRVLKKWAPLVVWSYGLSSISPEIDNLCFDLYQNTLGDYWPPERLLVEEAYQSISFPFTHVTRHKQFSMKKNWSREQFIGYLSSWSATQHFIDAGNDDPLKGFEEKIERYWKGSDKKLVVWPLIVVEARD